MNVSGQPVCWSFRSWPSSASRHVRRFPQLSLPSCGGWGLSAHVILSWVSCQKSNSYLLRLGLIILIGPFHFPIGDKKQLLPRKAPAMKKQQFNDGKPGDRAGWTCTYFTLYIFLWQLIYNYIISDICR